MGNRCGGGSVARAISATNCVRNVMGSNLARIVWNLVSLVSMPVKGRRGARRQEKTSPRNRQRRKRRSRARIKAQDLATKTSPMRQLATNLDRIASEASSDDDQAVTICRRRRSWRHRKADQCPLVLRKTAIWVPRRHLVRALIWPSSKD